MYSYAATWAPHSFAGGLRRDARVSDAHRAHLPAAHAVPQLAARGGRAARGALAAKRREARLSVHRSGGLCGALRGTHSRRRSSGPHEPVPRRDQQRARALLQRLVGPREPPHCHGVLASAPSRSRRRPVPPVLREAAHDVPQAGHRPGARHRHGQTHAAALRAEDNGGGAEGECWTRHTRNASCVRSRDAGHCGLQPGGQSRVRRRVGGRGGLGLRGGCARREKLARGLHKRERRIGTQCGRPLARGAGGHPHSGQLRGTSAAAAQPAARGGPLEPDAPAGALRPLGGAHNERVLPARRHRTRVGPRRVPDVRPAHSFRTQSAGPDVFFIYLSIFPSPYYTQSIILYEYIKILIQSTCSIHILRFHSSTSWCTRCGRRGASWWA